MEKRELYNNILKRLKTSLSLEFKDESILLSALTHKSYSNENKGSHQDNQRLEFLGDSVLSLVITDYLYKKFSDENEGALSKMKSGLVSEKTLSEIAKELDLGRFILLGRGEDKEDSRIRASLLADLFEAIIGAIYLDGGLPKAKTFVLTNFDSKLKEIDANSISRDYKTIFQEKVQNKYKCPPKYITTSVVGEGIVGNDKLFISVLYANDKEVSRAFGKNKKDAEMNAAKIAITIFK